jgi:hypothetical protein
MAEKTSKPSTTDKLVLAIVQGMNAERVAAGLGVAPEDVPRVVDEARRKLTLAADYNRDEQLGTAISRLNELWGKAMRPAEGAPADVRTAVAVQKELNRLLDLYRPPSRNAGDANAGAAEELAAVRAYLAPLKLAAEATATAELARLAVSELMELRARA